MKIYHRLAGTILSFSLLVPLQAFLSAADKDGKITYEDHILPLLDSKCLNCHNPDEAKGGLDLSTYGAAMQGGSGGEVAITEDLSSRILTLMAHTEEPFMPPKKPKASDDELKLMADWIAGGLRETMNSSAKKSSKPKLDMSKITSTGKPDGPPAMPKDLILEPEVLTERSGSVPALAHSPWAPILAVAGQKQVLLFHSEDFDLLGVIPYPEGFPQTLSFSSNGAFLACGGGRGGKSGNVVAWDIKTGERVIEVGKEFDIVLGADISPDLKKVIMGGPGRNIKIWDTVAGEQITSIKKHPDWMLTGAFSPDGVIFATGGRSGALYVWEAATGYEFFTLKGHTKAVTDVAWRSDGNLLASCSEDGQVMLWEMNGGKQIKKWTAHSGGALAVTFAPNGTIATVGRDKTLKLWKGDGAAIRTIPASTDIVMSVAFSQDSKRVFSGDWTGTIKVWNAEDGKEIAQIAPNPPSIEQQIAYSKKRITDITTQLPKLEAGVKAVSTQLAAARKKLTDIQKIVADSTKIRDSHKGKVAQLNAQAKTFTTQQKQAQDALNQKNAVVKQRSDALNNENKAFQTHQAAVTKWTAELKKRETTLQQTLAALTAAKAEAAKPVLDANQQKLLNDIVNARNTADGAKKAADGNVAAKAKVQSSANTQVTAARAAHAAATKTLTLHKAARDQAKKNLDAANAARVEADANIAAASKSGQAPAPAVLEAQRRAAQNQTATQSALNASSAQLVKTEASNKAALAKVQQLTTALTKANAELDAARKDQANKTTALAALDAKIIPLRAAETSGKARVAKAKADLVTKTTAHQNAEKARNSHKAQVDNAAKLLAASQAKVKAAQTALATAQAEAKTATATLAAKNKALADTRTQIVAVTAEAKKAEAALAAAAKQLEGATKAVAAVVAKEAAAKQSFEVAKAELKTSQFLEKKFQAAAINLTAREESDEMEDMTTELEGMLEDETEAKEEVKKATAARADAEKTLAVAKKTVDEGTKKLATTSSSVLEQALALVSNRAMAELREEAIKEKSEGNTTTDQSGIASDVDGSDSTSVNDVEDKVPVAEVLAGKDSDKIKQEIAALQKQLADLEGFLKKSYVEADKTKATVMKASEVAAKTPAILAERSKAEQQAAKELAEAEAERKRQEAALAKQKKLVDDLKQKYIKSVPKREE